MSHKIDVLLGVLETLVDRLEFVHSDPRYQAVWQMAQAHLGPYEGPQYTHELELAKTMLREVKAGR